MIRNNLYTYLQLLALALISGSPAVLAQDPTASRLQEDWQQYQSANIQEKVFVHAGKTFYLVGETLWFKIYDVDAGLHKPGFSTIAYAELLDKNQQPVLQARISLREGRGSGSFLLPASISSGNYQLRCYTSWMKNFDPGLFFKQEITIVNTLKTAAPEMVSAPALSARLFPEGGNLVYGLTSRLAFKAVNKDQHGLPCTGFLLDDKKDTMTRFSSNPIGMGSFMLKPAKGQKYTVVIRSADSTVIVDLPPVYDDGYVMHLTEEPGDKVRIVVNTTRSSQNPSVYLLVHTGRQLKNVQTANISEGHATFIVDKATLGSGTSHLTIFDASRTPVCERLYFKQPSIADKVNIDIRLSGQSFATRKKADLNLTTTGQQGQPLKAHLSLAVFLLDSLQNIPQEDIVSHLLLSSDLKGQIEHPRYYIEDSSAEAKEALDNLLLTQGWSRFRWEEVLQRKKPYFEFLPETNGPLITGKLIDKNTGRTVPSVIGYLSVPGRSFTFGAAKSRQDGSMLFNTKNFYNSSEIIVQTNALTSDSNYRIDIVSPFYDRPYAWKITPFNISPALENELLSRSIGTQAENAYLLDRKRKLLPAPDLDSLSFYGNGDHQYKLDDYTRFQTIEEVMREYIDEVHVPKQSGKFHFRVRNNLFNAYFDDDPLMLIDGSPVYDAEKLLALDPLKIKQIDVVARKFFIGPLGNDGIVSYKTYNGDLGGYQLDANAISVHYDGLQLQREFYSPIYDNTNMPPARIPDLRNLLQWIPDIDTREEGKYTSSFYTSDIPGTYALVVQGITDQGLPGSKVITFTVQ